VLCVLFKILVWTNTDKNVSGQWFSCAGSFLTGYCWSLSMCVCVFELPGRYHKYATALHCCPVITKPLNLIPPTPSFPACVCPNALLSPFPKAVCLWNISVVIRSFGLKCSNILLKICGWIIYCVYPTHTMKYKHCNTKMLLRLTWATMSWSLWHGFPWIIKQIYVFTFSVFCQHSKTIFKEISPWSPIYEWKINE